MRLYIDQGNCHSSAQVFNPVLNPTVLDQIHEEAIQLSLVSSDILTALSTFLDGIASGATILKSRLSMGHSNT